MQLEFNLFHGQELRIGDTVIFFEKYKRRGRVAKVHIEPAPGTMILRAEILSKGPAYPEAPAPTSAEHSK